MKLKIEKIIKKEILHYVCDDLRISSQYRHVFFEDNSRKIKISMPDGIVKRFFGLFRLSRRALRLDKCNVYYTKESLVIVRQGDVYYYNLMERKLVKTLNLKNCRNFLHQSISESPEGFIYMGEYGANKEKGSVPVYRSTDKGKSWELIFEFKPGQIKHIHGCYYDKYSDQIWVCTGDFKGENYLVCGNKDFSEVNWIGNGEQVYRACNVFFEPKKVHWIMDSQLETSFHVVYDRVSKEIEINKKFLGPVWYIKRLTDGVFLATTAHEVGDGVLDDYAHVYWSKDLENWELLKSFKPDGLPKKYFKNSIISFPDGKFSSKEAYMFFEAVKKYDGKSIKFSIQDK